MRYIPSMAIHVSAGFQPEPVLGFDHEKSVQCIGFFLRAAGKPIEKLKLIKLIYLADRLSLRERGKPLNFDDYYSMPHGPVASSALNGLNRQFSNRAWSKLALGNDNKTVMAAHEIPADHLSRADTRILQAIWDEFGSFTASQLRAWTHHNCPEYVEVESSRISILPEEIFEAIGDEDPDGSARHLKSLQRQLGRLERICGT